MAPAIRSPFKNLIYVKDVLRKDDDGRRYLLISFLDIMCQGGVQDLRGNDES